MRSKTSIIFFVSFVSLWSSIRHTHYWWPYTIDHTKILTPKVSNGHLNTDMIHLQTLCRYEMKSYSRHSLANWKGQRGTLSYGRDSTVRLHYVEGERKCRHYSQLDSSASILPLSYHLPWYIIALLEYWYAEPIFPYYFLCCNLTLIQVTLLGTIGSAVRLQTLILMLSNSDISYS